MGNHHAHIIQRLSQRIATRATADPQHSYTARLLHSPKEMVLRKVGEEALEVVLAAQSTDRRTGRSVVSHDGRSAAVLDRPRRGFCRTGKALQRGG